MRQALTGFEINEAVAKKQHVRIKGFRDMANPVLAIAKLPPYYIGLKRRKPWHSKRIQDRKICSSKHAYRRFSDTLSVFTICSLGMK